LSRPYGDKKPKPFVPIERPPFHKHIAKGGVLGSPNAIPYVVGDTREWNGDTFYFCDATTHKDQSHWHKHKATACSLRSKWLIASRGGTTTPGGGAQAHLGTAISPEIIRPHFRSTSTAPDLPPGFGPFADSTPSADGDLAMLSFAMNRQSNPVVKEYLARALLEMEDSA
jgi:hypothetical protein